MKDTKLRRLMDFQKIEKNPSLDFAIQSAQSYVSLSQKKGAKELSENELEMLNAAGVLGDEFRTNNDD